MSEQTNAARLKEINDLTRYTMWSVFRLRDVLGETADRAGEAAEVEKLLAGLAEDDVVVRGTLSRSGSSRTFTRATAGSAIPVTGGPVEIFSVTGDTQGDRDGSSEAQDGDRSVQGVLEFPTDQFRDALIEELDVLYEEGATSGRIMNVGLHPHVSGRAHRIRALREFIQHAQSLPGVWWATREEIADWYLANHESHIPGQAG